MYAPPDLLEKLQSFMSTPVSKSSRGPVFANEEKDLVVYTSYHTTITQLTRSNFDYIKTL